MWHRDDPGFPPSPDPASQAEDYFYRQSMADPDDSRDVCPDCRDRGWFVGRDSLPDCEACHGAGVYLGHTDACTEDLCALNGDLFSCAGEMQPCACTTVNCEPCTVRERDAEVAHQRTLPLSADDTEVPF